jgi:hypothetical protein
VPLDDKVSCYQQGVRWTCLRVFSHILSQAKAVVKHRIAPQLAKLTLFHGTKHKNWDESVMAPTHHMHPFSESKVRSLCRQTKGKKWAIYNQSHMTRTFPGGSRVDSSNYNPILAWSQGC